MTMLEIDKLLQQLPGGSGDLSKYTGMMQPLMNQLQNAGGLNSVLDKLRQSGLGEQVDSWLSPGENKPVDPEVLGDAVGSDAVSELAEETGESDEAVKSDLSHVLPDLVNKLSPGGSLPTADQVTSLLGHVPGAEQLTGMLQGVLGGGK